MKRLLLLLTACGSRTETPPIEPRVLIIGDSISEDYTAQLLNLNFGIVFQHSANPPGDYLATNAMNTEHGVAQIDYWLDQAGGVDLVTYNQGLWDIEGALPSVSLADYESNMRFIVSRIQARKIKLIFFTTTYTPLSTQQNTLRNLDNIMAYNAAAVKVMQAAGVPIYDLFTVAYNNRQYFIDGPNGGDVHFTTQGSANLARAVLDACLENLR